MTATMTTTIKILTFIWFLVMTILSHTPGDRSKEESGWLSKVTRINESLLRKLAHVFCFALLAALSALAFPTQHPLVVAFVLAWSGLDEATKIPVPGRHFSWYDVGLNAAGTIVGFILGTILVRVLG